MDQQNRNPEASAPKHVPTEAEIARAEAEAVAALRGGKAPAGPAAGEDRAARAVPEDFVPYVDDVTDPEPAAAPDDGDDEGEYIPSAWEKRIDALPPETWRLYQIIGGAAMGLVAIASLFIFGEELSTYGLIVAALLALILPRYLERAWRRKLTTARYAMAAAMVVGLLAMGLIVGLRTGFVFTK